MLDGETVAITVGWTVADSEGVEVTVLTGVGVIVWDGKAVSVILGVAVREGVDEGAKVIVAVEEDNVGVIAVSVTVIGEDTPLDWVGLMVGRAVGDNCV